MRTCPGWGGLGVIPGSLPCELHDPRQGHCYALVSSSVTGFGLHRFFFFFFNFGLTESWLWCMGFSLVATRGGFSSCDTRALLLCNIWDLCSPTRDQACIPCLGRRILNCWATRESLDWCCRAVLCPEVYLAASQPPPARCQ